LAKYRIAGLRIEEKLFFFNEAYFLAKGQSSLRVRSILREKLWPEKIPPTICILFWFPWCWVSFLIWRYTEV